MTKREKQVRNGQVIKYRLDGHSAQETANKFNLSLGHVFKIMKQYKSEQQK